MILVVGGTKGGGGKTTLATNLVVARSRKNKKILFVDADEQKSSICWTEQRESKKEDYWVTISLSGTTIHTQLQKLKDNYDDIIIDTGGRDTTSQRSALICADVFLIPFRPRSLDIWTFGKVKELIEDVKLVNPDLICVAIINQADHVGKDNATAMEILMEYKGFIIPNVTIGNRKSYANAAADGLSILELNDQKAIKEINHLSHIVFGDN